MADGLAKHFQTHHGSFLGKTHKPETKIKISLSKKNKHKGCENPAYGKHWYMNPETGESCFVKEENVPEGWVRGRRLHK